MITPDVRGKVGALLTLPPQAEEGEGRAQVRISSSPLLFLQDEKTRSHQSLQ